MRQEARIRGKNTAMGMVVQNQEKEEESKHSNE